MAASMKMALNSLRTAAILLLAGAAYAQDYPTRPIRIVTATPGGGNDYLARIIAPALGARWASR